MSYEKFIQKDEVKNKYFDRAFNKYINLFQNEIQNHVEKGYRHILFDSKPIQSAELNEVQSLAHYNTKTLGESIFSSDGVLAKSPNLIITYYKQDGTKIDSIEDAYYYKLAINSESVIYFDGSFFPVKPKNYNEYFRLTDDSLNELTEEVGIYITEELVTVDKDSSLYDPKAVSDLGVLVEDGATRFKITCEWMLSSELKTKIADNKLPNNAGENFYIIYMIKGGINRTTLGFDTNLKNITNIVSRYDFNANGNYVLNGLITNYLDSKKLNGNTLDRYTISKGSANVKGYNFTFTENNLISFPDVSATVEYLKSATDIELTGFKATQQATYNIHYFYGLHEITKITGQKMYGPVTLTRGNDNLNPTKDNIVGLNDGNPDKNNESFHIVKINVINNLGKTFTENVDFKISDDLSSIEWITKNCPDWGDSYQINYIYDFSYLKDTNNELYKIGNKVTISPDRTEITVLANIFHSSTKTVELDFTYSPKRYEVITLKYSQLGNGITIGEFIRFIGKPDLFKPQLPTINEENNIILSTILCQYGKKPEIIIDYTRVFKMSDILEIYKRLDTIEYNIAKNSLFEKVSMDLGDIQYRDLFVDTFKDQEKRDLFLEDQFTKLL